MSNPKVVFEPKPWHGAEDREVWEITVNGEELLCRSNSDGDFTPVFGHRHWVTIANGSHAITAGRRIWPEVAGGGIMNTPNETPTQAHDVAFTERMLEHVKGDLEHMRKSRDAWMDHAISIEATQLREKLGQNKEEGTVEEDVQSVFVGANLTESNALGEWLAECYDRAEHNGWHDRAHDLGNSTAYLRAVGGVEGADSSNPELFEHILVKTSLIASEVFEAIDAARNTGGFAGYVDAETGKPEGFVVELGDAVIRIFDLIVLLGAEVDFVEWMSHKLEYNDTRGVRHGGKHC